MSLQLARFRAVCDLTSTFDGLTHDLFTVNTCLATGVKMIIWFIGGPMDRERLPWNDNQELVCSTARQAGGMRCG